MQVIVLMVPSFIWILTTLIIQDLYPVSHGIIHQTVSVFDIFISYLEYSTMLSIRFFKKGNTYKINHLNHF